MPKPASTALMVLAGVGFIVILIVFARDYGRVPDIVPTHFDGSGAPNQLGPKSTFVIFPVISLVMLGIVATICTFGLSSRNVPVPPALPVLTCLVFVELIWILAFAQAGSFAVALGQATVLKSTIMWVGLSAVLLTAFVMVCFAVTAAVRSRPR